MEITLEKFDSISVKKASGGSYCTYLVQQDMTFTPGMVINTDTYPGLMEIARKYVSLYVTPEHKEQLDRACGMTTNMQQVNRK